jgi:hypothetical protein
MSRKGKVAVYAAAAVVLAGVFALYAKPQIMVAMSEMIWACFR